MIKGLMGNQGVVVSGGNTSLPYVNQNNTNPMQGMLRIWGSDMQVFDGNNWMTLSTSYATVSLDPDSQSLLQWARDQRNRQLERDRRIQNNPALQKAYEVIQRAEDNFDILDKIIGDESENQAYKPSMVP